MTSTTFHHTPITMTQPTSCVNGATPPPHSQPPFTHWQARHSTWIPEHVSWLSRLGRLLPSQWRGRGKVKGRVRWGGTPTTVHMTSTGPALLKPTNLRHQSNWLTHTETTHGQLDIPLRFKVTCFDVGNYWTFVQGNFLSLMLPGSCWPHPAWKNFYMCGFLGQPPPSTW